MTKQDLGLPPHRPDDVVTVSWFGQQLDTFRPIPQVGSIATATEVVINTDLWGAFNITDLATDVVIDASGTPQDHQKLMVRIVDAGIGQTVTWNSIFHPSGVAIPLGVTLPGKIHHVGFIYDSQVPAWICLAVDNAGAV